MVAEQEREDRQVDDERWSPGSGERQRDEGDRAHEVAGEVDPQHPVQADAFDDAAVDE